MPTPGSAEYLAQRLNGRGLGCSHFPKYHLDDTESARRYPSRLGFFHVTTPSLCVSFLDTNKLCEVCLNVVVPDGFNCWSNPAAVVPADAQASPFQASTPPKDFWPDATSSSRTDPKMFQAGTEGLTSHGMQVDGNAPRLTTPPTVLPISQIAGIEPVWSWLVHERKPFYIDQLHLPKGWHLLTQKTLEADRAIAKRFGASNESLFMKAPLEEATPSTIQDPLAAETLENPPPKKPKAEKAAREKAPKEKSTTEKASPKKTSSTKSKTTDSAEQSSVLEEPPADVGNTVKSETKKPKRAKIVPTEEDAIDTKDIPDVSTSSPGDVKTNQGPEAIPQPVEASVPTTKPKKASRRDSQEPSARLADNASPNVALSAAVVKPDVVVLARPSVLPQHQEGTDASLKEKLLSQTDKSPEAKSASKKEKKKFSNKTDDNLETESTAKKEKKSTKQTYVLGATSPVEANAELDLTVKKDKTKTTKKAFTGDAAVATKATWETGSAPQKDKTKSTKKVTPAPLEAVLHISPEAGSKDKKSKTNSTPKTSIPDAEGSPGISAQLTYTKNWTRYDPIPFESPIVNLTLADHKRRADATSQSKIIESHGPLMRLLEKAKKRDGGHEVVLLGPGAPPKNEKIMKLLGGPKNEKGTDLVACDAGFIKSITESAPIKPKKEKSEPFATGSVGGLKRSKDASDTKPTKTGEKEKKPIKAQGPATAPAPGKPQSIPSHPPKHPVQGSKPKPPSSPGHPEKVRLPQSDDVKTPKLPKLPKLPKFPKPGRPEKVRPKKPEKIRPRKPVKPKDPRKKPTPSPGHKDSDGDSSESESSGDEGPGSSDPESNGPEDRDSDNENGPDDGSSDEASQAGDSKPGDSNPEDSNPEDAKPGDSKSEGPQSQVNSPAVPPADGTQPDNTNAGAKSDADNPDTGNTQSNAGGAPANGQSSDAPAEDDPSAPSGEGTSPGTPGNPGDSDQGAGRTDTNPVKDESSKAPLPEDSTSKGPPAVVDESPNDIPGAEPGSNTDQAGPQTSTTNPSLSQDKPTDRSSASLKDGPQSQSANSSQQHESKDQLNQSELGSSQRDLAGGQSGQNASLDQGAHETDTRGSGKTGLVAASVVVGAALGAAAASVLETDDLPTPIHSEPNTPTDSNHSSPCGSAAPSESGGPADLSDFDTESDDGTVAAERDSDHDDSEGDDNDHAQYLDSDEGGNEHDVHDRDSSDEETRDDVESVANVHTDDSDTGDAHDDTDQEDEAEPESDAANAEDDDQPTDDDDNDDGNSGGESEPEDSENGGSSDEGDTDSGGDDDDDDDDGDDGDQSEGDDDDNQSDGDDDGQDDDDDDDQDDRDDTSDDDGDDATDQDSGDQEPSEVDDDNDAESYDGDSD